MIDRLTDEELAAIRERVEKVWEGPWAVLPVDEVCDRCENVYEVVSLERFLCPVVSELKDKDIAEFIAHARDDIPKLLAEIDRLKEQLREDELLIRDLLNLAFD